MAKPYQFLKVTSLGDLRQKAGTDPRYLQLALVSARNLGGHPIDTLDQAMTWLFLNASETDENGVVGEVNFCRDLVK
jgi:hypothetical protein